MGVDACMFAMKAKKYVYFDRLHAIEKFWDLDGREYEDASLVFDLLEKKRGVPNAKVLEFLNANLKAWKKFESDGSQGKSGWIEHLIKFVNAHPDDEFMVVTDHEEPPSWDYQKKYNGDYEEWKP